MPPMPIVFASVTSWLTMWPRKNTPDVYTMDKSELAKVETNIANARKSAISKNCITMADEADPVEHADFEPYDTHIRHAQDRARKQKHEAQPKELAQHELHARDRL